MVFDGFWWFFSFCSLEILKKNSLFSHSEWLPVALNLAITDERFRVELNLIVAKMSTFRVPGGARWREKQGQY